VNPRWGTVFDGATGGRTPAECSDLADAIAGNFEPGQSVVVMRFDYLTHAIRGYRQYRYYGSCVPYSEAAARTCAKHDSSLQLPFDPTAPTAQGACLTDRSMDIGPWVFRQAPPDGGGVVLVDHGVGLVFAASIALDGRGEIVVPTKWNTADIGVGCITTGGTAPAQAYDLRSGGKLTAAEARSIAALAQGSVLPGIWDVWGGYSSVPLVMLYPRTTADFDPQTAEYVVAILGNTAGN
jgi:hypothetical protein